MDNSKLLVLTLLSCSIVGCSDGGGEKFPEVKVDPSAVASNIFSEFDSNSDGELSKTELKKSPGLVMLTTGESMMLQELRLDADGSGAVSLEEMETKLAKCFADLRQGYSCCVMYRGQPLEGATVTLIPEDFMGDLPIATGETDRDGNCSVATDDGLDGAVPGIYRVEITHPEKKIAKKYNESSKISIALDPTNPYATEGVPKFSVK